jgi:hypothetical protein
MSRAFSLRSPFVAGLAAAGLVFAAAPALAQANACAQGQKIIMERQNLFQQWNNLAGKGKKVDPRTACNLMTKLVSNGETGLKWLEGNKDWCQVPDQIAEGFKQSQQQAKDARGKACQIAAQMNEMEKKAKEAQRGGGNPFGGGLTGEYKIPQGAL